MSIFLVLGVKRSGNHLLINWMISHYQSNFFLNNCYPNKIKSKNKLLNFIDYLPKLKYELKLLSFEFPQKFYSDLTETELCDLNKLCQTTFIARDPLNWMSSFLHKNTHCSNIESDYVKNHQKYWDIWLECYCLWSNNDNKINYNKFVESKDYRLNIANLLGFKFDDFIDKKIINTLWYYKELNGIPSSFDSKAENLNVFNRYKKIRHLLEIKPIPNLVWDAINEHWSDCYDL